MITIYAAMLSAVLGSAVAYDQLDLPWFASDHDVQAVQQTVASDIEDVYQDIASNTKLILGQEWERLRAKMYELRDRLAQNPSNRDLQKDLARAEAQLREVERKLSQ